MFSLGDLLIILKSKPERVLCRKMKNLIGFYPGNCKLYSQALRHNSMATEIGNTGLRNNNERLEFLGDAILGGVVAEVLFKKFPFKDEGFLTELRSKMVNREQLNAIAMKMGINQMVELDSKLQESPNRFKSVYGNVFEAIIGAIYLDKGYPIAKSFIEKRVMRYYLDIDELAIKEHNFKSRLINWAQKEGHKFEFVLLKEVNTGSYKQFKIQLLIDGVAQAEGMDFSKRKAEQVAAENACKKLGI